MELKNNTVWVVRSDESFAIFSSKEYAEDYKKSLVEIWKKSIVRDTIPRRLNNTDEINKYYKDYPEVISVENDHYSLVRGSVSNEKGMTSYQYYALMSNKEWDKYYQDFVSDFVIEDYVILK